MASDAIVVGAGPNGLAAAVALARAGRSVHVLEAASGLGGGLRSEALTLPGFLHDLCSAIHPFGAASPFLSELPLAAHGLEWVHPPADLAHPFDDGEAAVLSRSLKATAETLGEDADAYGRLFGPLVACAESLVPELLRPPLHLPRHPLRLARFGLTALRSARGLAFSCFRGERARALFAGCAAHSTRPLEAPLTAAFGLVFPLLSHHSGWPFPRGGSQRLADALAAHLRSLGGTLETGRRVGSLAELPAARAVLFDLTPRQLLEIAGPHFPARYRRRLERWRYGPSAFKLDFALSGPVPWRAEQCARAATVHLGGSFDEIAASEAACVRGELAERPFVLLAQPSLFDPSRAPAGRHTLWAYCHVPFRSRLDASERIVAQIERFAPGFRDLVLARAAAGPAELEARNPNLVGGDIAGGSTDPVQFLFRSGPKLVPWATPDPRLFLCSASTPPGPGVHGMCGYYAARAALAGVLR